MKKKPDYRKREWTHRPKLWKFFTLFFLFLPLIQYAMFAQKLGFALSRPEEFFRIANAIPLFLVFFPLVLFFGVLNFKRWSWIVLTEYSVVWFCYQFYLLWQHAVYYNYIEHVIVVALFGSLLYFNRDDVRHAYREDFMSIPRGWRNARRYKLNKQIRIGEKTYTTQDISHKGFSIPYEQGFAVNSRVLVSVHLEQQDIRIAAGVVRNTPTVTAFAFRDMPKAYSAALKHYLKIHRKEEYLKNK